MPVVELATIVSASAERLFDLSRSVDLHVASTRRTGERAVAGVTVGVLGPGDQVTWRARHFGVWQQVTSGITVYDRPRHFRDSMIRGAFRRFDHDHYFEPIGGDSARTLMRDVFDFTSPLGLLGALADRWFLVSHLRGLLEERNRFIKEIAESDGWRIYLTPGAAMPGELEERLPGQGKACP
jgi:ligand-binding SRPBCC domain-containing protein